VTFKVVRTFGLPANEYEQEVLDRIGAKMEIVPFMPGQCTEEQLLSVSRDADAVISLYETFNRNVINVDYPLVFPYWYRLLFPCVLCSTNGRR